QLLDGAAERLRHFLHRLLVYRHRLELLAAALAVDERPGRALRAPDHDRVGRDPGQLDADRNAIRLVHDRKHMASLLFRMKPPGRPGRTARASYFNPCPAEHPVAKFTIASE